MEHLFQQLIEQQIRTNFLLSEQNGLLKSFLGSIPHEPLTDSSLIKQEDSTGTPHVIEVKSWKDISLAEGEYLMTIGDALRRMNVVRATLFNLREDGLIRSYKKGRSVRFRSSDIEDAICWYSIPKGKI